MTFSSSKCTSIRISILPGSFVSALIVAAVSGCGGNGTVPINPLFLYDGQPLADASVAFVRTTGEKGRGSFGTTEKDGRAKMTTYQPNDGVPPGQYQIVVIKPPANAMTFEPTAEEMKDPKIIARMSSMQDSVPKGPGKRVRTTIPEVYSDPGTTPLTCTVTKSTSDFTFELKSEKKLK